MMPDIFNDTFKADDTNVTPWLLRFTQAYEDGLKVEKKGLDATFMVIKKYGIASDEVVAFSSDEGRRRALTVFHFHPEFPSALRRGYMETHGEGCDLAKEVAGHTARLRDERLSEWRSRTQGLARVAGLTAQALALYVVAHWPEAR